VLDWGQAAAAAAGPFDGRVWLNTAHQGPLPRPAVEAAEQASIPRTARGTSACRCTCSTAQPRSTGPWTPCTGSRGRPAALAATRPARWTPPGSHTHPFGPISATSVSRPSSVQIGYSLWFIGIGPPAWRGPPVSASRELFDFPARALLYLVIAAAATAAVAGAGSAALLPGQGMLEVAAASGAHTGGLGALPVTDFDQLTEQGAGPVSHRNDRTADHGRDLSRGLAGQITGDQGLGGRSALVVQHGGGLGDDTGLGQADHPGLQRLPGQGQAAPQVLGQADQRAGGPGPARQARAVAESLLGVT
jgi:hypothetical protein